MHVVDDGHRLANYLQLHAAWYLVLIYTLVASPLEKLLRRGWRPRAKSSVPSLADKCFGELVHFRTLKPVR
jgi:hypothetical protein